MSYQKITLVGRLGRAPKMKYQPDGTAVTDFSLAVNERNQFQKGREHGKVTTWFEITCWDKLAETTAEHLEKGRLVLVEGKVKTPRIWTNRNGEACCNLEVTARDVQFLDAKQGATLGDEYEEDTSEGSPEFKDEQYNTKEEKYEIEDVTDIIPYR